MINILMEAVWSIDDKVAASYYLGGKKKLNDLQSTALKQIDAGRLRVVADVQ